MVRKHLEAQGEKLEVVEDPEAGYFGMKVDDRSLTPGENARLGAIRYDEWARHAVAVH